MRNSGKLDDDVDALFTLPLAEFTGARNALAARLKKSGHDDQANQVKALVKPSISAWAANQLYWQHRKAFDQLIATGQRFRKAQIAGKVADVHAALDARREALLHLSELATALLRDGGHNPSPDTERRITTTLEALSVYGSLPGGPPSGRLTHDVDPPGFDSLASLMSGAGMPKLTLVPARLPQSRRVSSTATDARRKTASPGKQEKTAAAEARRLAETRKATIAAAKVSLQDAKRLLSDARAKEKRAQSAQEKANAEAKEAEKHRREAEQRFKKAQSVSEFANRRAAHAAGELEDAAKALEDATRAVEEAAGELEVLGQYRER